MVDLGYARVSTTKQDLDRQVDALTGTGIPAEQVYVDKKSGATTARPGLAAVLNYARNGDVIVIHTLDRLGRTVRDTLNLIYDLHQRGIGVRNLADPIRIDSTNPDDPMGQLAVVLLALFGQMERTYSLERAAHARAVATAKGRRVGRPSVVSESQLAHAVQLRDAGHTIAEITTRTGLTRSTLYRHLPERTHTVTAEAAGDPSSDDKDAAGGRLAACPTCGHQPATRADAGQQVDDLTTDWVCLDEEGQVQHHRHCLQCQPRHGQVRSLECARCGDGPLLAAHEDDLTADIPTPLADWLTHHGWTLDPELRCPQRTCRST